MKQTDDKILDAILDDPKFLQDLHAASPSPKAVGHRKKRIDWFDVYALVVMCAIGFCAGVVFWMRLTDGRPI